MTSNMKNFVLCFITFVLLFTGTVYAADKENCSLLLGRDL